MSGIGCDSADRTCAYFGETLPAAAGYRLVREHGRPGNVAVLIYNVDERIDRELLGLLFELKNEAVTASPLRRVEALCKAIRMLGAAMARVLLWTHCCTSVLGWCQEEACTTT